jgi:ABC-type bacteriocin/lantibiotic exporter with double-glycine peptidase domain
VVPVTRGVDFIPQMEVTECGAAALAMVLGHHGHHAGLAQVRLACGVGRDGSSAGDLVRAARGFGLEANGVRAELEQLGLLTLPAILHWDFDHFVVLERLRGDRAVLVDPASGRRRMTVAELGRHFTGAALQFRPTPELRPLPRRRPSLARYRAEFLRNLPALGQILLATGALEVVGLVFPVANQLLLDRVVLPRQEPWLWGLAIGLGSACLANAALALVRGRVLLALQTRLGLILVTRFLDHLLRLPLGFFQQRNAGELVQRVQSNAVLQELLSTQAITLLLDTCLLLGYAALMLAFHVRLGALVIALSLLQTGLMLALWDRNRQLIAAGLAAAGREAAAMLEAVTALETTKACSAERRMIQRWAHRRTGRINNDLEQQRLALASGAGLALLQGLGAVLVTWVGGREVISQGMTLGTFVAFLTLQGLFLKPMGSLAGALVELQTLGNQLRRLDDVLETAAEPVGGADPGRLRGAIVLREVSFRYGPGAPLALAEVSLAIAPGEKVALVGPSGAGKSTLARLLLGLHLPERGSLRFDGRELGELDLPALRRQVGVVLQETFLFDDTVRANLSLHDDNLSLERLRRAARLACVEEVIDALPGGFEARVGENGALLSGGQRQRLSMARALAHDPAILLLDEATSSLDGATEAQVHANLAGLGCTRIVIAHRLATVRDADRILVLQAGRIVQTGSYPELVGQAGLFRQLLSSLEDRRG